MWYDKDDFAPKYETLKLRASLIKKMRAFFEDHDYIEVETPVLQISSGMEVHIKVFETEIVSANRGQKMPCTLRTSPELAMKKLLVAGMEKIYQICKVFRNAEGSSLHSCEFTMLEWYHVGLSYEQLMDEVEGFIKSLNQEVLIYKDKVSNPNQKWQRISVCEAFTKYANIDLETCLEERDLFAKHAKAQNIRVDDQANWEDIFFAVFLEQIEPFLGTPTPTILYDYPISMAALAQKSPKDSRFAERFELYICGVELANAFGELTDAKEQRARFQKAQKLKQKIYQENMPIDEAFLQALEYGMPMVSGIALGVDRLIMLCLDQSKIEDVQAVPTLL